MVNLAAWILGYLRPYRGRALAVILLVLAETGLTALAPWPLKVLVDNVLGGAPFPPAVAARLPAALDDAVMLLLAVVAAGLVVQLGAEAVRMAHTQMQVDMAQRVVYRLREQLLHHLQALPLRHHVAARTADSVYRLDADAYCVDDLVIGGVFPLTVAAMNLGLMFGVLLYVDATLALLSLSVAPFLYLTLRHHARTLTDRAERVKNLESGLIERILAVLSSIAAVKSFTRERHELERFADVGDRTRRARLDLTWQESVFSVTVTGVTLLGTALVLGVGGLHVLEGRLTVGSLLVVVAYLAAVYTPISEIARTTGTLQQAVVSARRVRELLALTPEAADAPGSVSADGVRGHVRFEDVDFAYEPGRPVLRGVSFEARPGELVALVGPTGAGKTTAANLVPRLYEHQGGRILIDGVDAARYGLRSLRRQVALVPQQPVLFSGTIADNIRYGRLDAGDEEVEAAARAAHVHDFVARLPRGYQTDVAEDGASLSGGERQRIGIARALLKDAPILLLDEPTSALDAMSEAAVIDALRELRAGRTTIVIAHRLSTVRDATRIVVIERGKVAASGPHDELMRTNGLYRAMCTRLSLGWSRRETATVDELIEDAAAGPAERPGLSSEKSPEGWSAGPPPRRERPGLSSEESSEDWLGRPPPRQAPGTGRAVS